MNYFDEPTVRAWLITYQSLEDKTTPEAIALRDKIMVEVGKVVNGIIFTHRFTAYDQYDDLYQEAMMACLGALDRFDPSYITSTGKPASLFNYASLTAKKALTFYTLRQSKHRGHADVTEFFDVASQESNLEETVDRIINAARRVCPEKHQPILQVFEGYIQYGVYNKRAFYRLCRTRGFSTSKTRGFMSLLKDNREELE